ncbi:MAG: 3-hydroxyisobutyrate dehydrogenase, partial [Haliea sp.]
MAQVAFIGLGNMGGPMASNLVKAGHTVQVFDLSEAACQQLADAGASVAPSAADAVVGAEYVISMLPAGKHVAGVYLGDNGLLAQLDSSTTVLDCSTIDAPTSRKVGEAAAALGIGFMDAPVSGGVAAAAAGTLAFMCGGEAATFEKAKVILADMGKNIFHAGPAGAGQVAKGCNNMLLAIHMIGTCEALEMGVRNGLDPKVLSEIMLASSGRNWSLEVYNPYPGVMEKAPASNDYKPGFMVDLM